MKKLLVTLLFAGILSFTPSFLHPLFSLSLSAQIPSNGLVAWYPFNGNANDESGNGNNGTVNGATLTSDRFGNLNRAYDFTSSIARIEIQDNAELSFTSTDFSFSAWVKLNDLASTPVGFGGYSIMTKRGTSSGDGFYFLIMGPGNDAPNSAPGSIGYSVSGGGSPQVFSNQQVSLNQWVYVTLIHQYSLSETSFYINGEFLNTETGTLPMVETNYNLWLGNDVGGMPYNFRGSLDDIALYNRALTPSEIQQLYQDQTGQVQQPLNCNITTPTTTLCAGQSATLTMNTTGGAGASSQLPTNLQQGLVAYYPFNGNANDESGNGNDGVVNGATLASDRLGSVGNAYSFYSMNDFIEVSTSNGQFDSQTYTISFWYRTNQGNYSGYYPRAIVSRSNFSNSPANVYDNFCIFEGGGAISLNYQGVGTIFNTPSGCDWLNSVNNDTWHLLTVVSEPNAIKTYTNGVLNVSTTFVPQISFQNYPLRFGKSSHSYWSEFNGLLDDITIYNRALSPSEIQQLYTAQSYAWSTNATTPTITVSPTSNTTYSCTVTQGNQTCTASVDITVNPAITHSVSATIIHGQSYTLGTQTLTTAGTYTEVFTSAAGCDSTVTLTLSVEPLLTCNITTPTTTLCAGQSATLTMNTTGGAGASSQLPVNLQQGLVAYYPFNGNANDESGNGNNGTVNGATLTSDRFGNTESAYLFDQDYIEIQSIQALNGMSDYSFSVWTNLDANAPNGQNYILCRGWDWSNGFDLWESHTNSFQIINGFYTFQKGTSSLNFTNNWKNIIVTRSSGLVSFFIDGQLDTTHTYSGLVGTNNENFYIGVHKWIGQNPGYFPYYFHGKIDDVGIWSRALSLSEISSLSSINGYSWSTNATTPTITVSPTTNTTYSCTVTQGNQTCTASVDITVNPAITHAVSATIVEGQSYTLGAQTLTTAGTYTEVFASAAGCDSTVTLTLAVEPLLTCNITAPTTTLCEGESVILSVNTAGGAGAFSQLPANLQQGLVAYYPFNGNANDESGYSNHGTIFNVNFNTDRNGLQNGCANFSGLSSSYISVPDANQIDLSNNFTFSVWLNLNSLNFDGVSGDFGSRILDKITPGVNNGYLVDFNFRNNGSNPDYQNYCSQGGRLRFIGSSIGSSLCSNELILPGWQNIVIIKQNSSVEFFRNGLSIGQIQLDSQAIPTNDFPLIIGNVLSANNIPFHGQMDDLFIYNRALFSFEIQQLFNAQSYAWSTGATTPNITVSPTTNTTYTCTVTSGTQTCTSSIDITVNPTITNAVSAMIVEGQSYTLGTQTLTTAGTYTEVFTSAAGCDSTVTLTLAVEPALSCNITASSTVLCGVDNVVLDLAPVNGVFYQSGLGNYQEFNGHYYLKYSGLANWYEAKSIAEQMGGHLVIPNTIEESNFIVALSETEQSGQPFFWIGISDEIQEGVWIDVLGNQITFSNWAVGEPNNENDEDFGLAYSLSVGNGHWNDGHYFHNLPFVIEFEGIVASVSWSTNETTSSITVSPTTNTTYSCTVTSGTQTCTSSIDIVVNPLQTFYADADGDGCGNPDVVVQDCNAPVGYVSDNTDCNDNNALVFFASTEICNGLDDDCDGLIDEGLTVTSIQPVSVSTALYPTCSGNALKSANLNNGTNSDLIEGSGLDLWYSLTAQYNTLRASLSAAFGDNEIRLYSYNNGCFELLETEHEVYTTTSLGTGNQVLISDDLIPGQTYYIAVHNISGSMNPSAKMCFNHFVGTTCDHYYSNNTGIYNNVCTSFKAQYKGNATNYIFDVLSATQNNANLNITPWSYTTTTASSIVPRIGTIFPVNMSASAKVYTLQIPVIYAIPDAAGNYTSITANSTSTCTVTLNPELPIALRSTDRCPNTKNTTSSISVDRAICGALRYEWEFTQQLPSVQPAVTVLGGLNTTAFFLNNVPGMGMGKTYNVRVRPIHTNGEVGNWGSVQCLKTGTAGMVTQSENAEAWANNYSPKLEGRYTLYPNPTSTGHFILTANHTSDEEVKSIQMMDITGKVVFQTQVVMNNNTMEIEFGNLASGVYVVMVGEERMRLVVE